MLSAIKELWNIYYKKGVVRAAAQLAYYLILSLFPLAICINAMLSGMHLDETDIFIYLQGIIPQRAYESIVEYLAYINDNYSTTMLIAAIMIFVSSASAGFRAILTIMAEIENEERYIGFWKTVLSVLLSIFFALAIFLSCVIIFTGEWFIGVITEYTGLKIFASLWQWLRFVVLFVLLFIMIFEIYQISAPKKRSGEQRIIGALASAVSLVGAGIFFSWTIGLSARYSLVYGSLASAVIIMLWLFMCGNILIMGNALNIVINNSIRRALEKGGDSPESHP